MLNKRAFLLPSVTLGKNPRGFGVGSTPFGVGSTPRNILTDQPHNPFGVDGVGISTYSLRARARARAHDKYIFLSTPLLQTGFFKGESMTYLGVGSTPRSTPLLQGVNP